ncbi:hypothetical protein RhiJN_10269 [Ceratobasidium sp. AG-Ba]|nr:hypothetical protein RhiJN_10269 [Ceratobasidium sp. AG-Ba]
MSTQENSHPMLPTPSANPQSRPPSAAILLTPASGVIPSPESLGSRQNSLPTPPATGASPLLHKSTKHGSGLRIMHLGPPASSLVPTRDRNAPVPATPQSMEPRIISK